MLGGKMHIKNLTLQNFKWFEHLEIDLHPNLTVIVGDNGSGKTSILEGIANALSTLLVGMDGLAGLKNDKNQVSLKAFHIGSTKDVQP